MPVEVRPEEFSMVFFDAAEIRGIVERAGFTPAAQWQDARAGFALTLCELRRPELRTVSEELPA